MQPCGTAGREGWDSRPAGPQGPPPRAGSAPGRRRAAGVRRAATGPRPCRTGRHGMCSPTGRCPGCGGWREAVRSGSPPRSMGCDRSVRRGSGRATIGRLGGRRRPRPGWCRRATGCCRPASAGRHIAGSSCPPGEAMGRGWHWGLLKCCKGRGGHRQPLSGLPILDGAVQPPVRLPVGDLCLPEQPRLLLGLEMRLRARVPQVLGLAAPPGVALQAGGGVPMAAPGQHGGTWAGSPPVPDGPAGPSDHEPSMPSMLVRSNTSMRPSAARWSAEPSLARLTTCLQAS